MENSAEGAALQQGGPGFLSFKAWGRVGHGLGSITSIAERYHGAAGFGFDRDAGVFRSTVLLIGQTAERLPQ